VSDPSARKDNVFDAVDRQIIQALQIDPRAGFHRIAAVLGVSEQTVARRYRRLRGDGLLRVIGLVDPRYLGQSEWMVRVVCRPGGVAPLAEALARRDDVSWVILSAGGSEIVCNIRSRSEEQRDDLLLQRLPATSQVISMTAHALLHRYRGGASRDWVGYGTPLTPEQIRALDPLPLDGPDAAGLDAAGLDAAAVTLEAADQPLLDLLAADGRASYAALAAAAGTTQGRVTRRLDALRRAGIVYFDVDMATELMGFRAAAYLWLTVEPVALVAAGEQLGAHEEVPFAAAITGPANLAASVVCRDTDDLYRYVTTRASALPGVRQLEVSPILRRIKQAGSRMSGARLAHPAPAARPRPAPAARPRPAPASRSGPAPASPPRPPRPPRRPAAKPSAVTPVPPASPAAADFPA
jgi:DNA-binding Lrp family transcriptional regulator